MFNVRVIEHFSAAHNLRNVKDMCERLHGHNYKVEVVLSGNNLDETGLLIDFKEIKKNVKIILEQLDHTYLNELSYFKDVNPSSENIAKFIYDKLFCFYDNILCKVIVWESDTSAAEYYI